MFLLLWAFVWVTAACRESPVADGEGGTVSGQADNKSETKIDNQRAGRVPVVLRVEYIKSIGGQKYAWDEVRVIDTLKNTSQRSFSGSFEIAHYDFETGIPKGVSTVYLERYAEGDDSRWKLLGGSAKLGVSHNKQ